MKIYSGKKRAIGDKNEKQEEELFKFDEDDDDEDDEDEDDDEDLESNAELSASDIEDQQYDDDVPDQKAWGKKRGHYYNADFVDKDYSTYTKEEEDLALAEEEEAQEIQRRLAQQLNDIDCDLELFGVKKVDDVNKILPETKLKVDFSDLDDRQKIQIFKKESPEFEGLINDFESNLKELSEFYTPIIDYAKSKKLNLPIFKILEARVSATNFYLTNLAFYLYMKIRKVQFKGHPIVKKLAQIKQLLTELDNKIENFKTDLNDLLDKIKTEDVLDIVPVGKVSRTYKEDSENDFDAENYNSNEDEDEMENDDEDGDDRRGITYQMAKNKGLTPHRKKENRNPRVKHRNKFRKALIRRKGAVRTVRKEIKRYDGEISGIKATVKKSIKLN